jgi:large subunit ribosomal protein L2
MVDFGRHSSMAGLVERLEYDPNRSGYIALVRYPAGVTRHIFRIASCSFGGELVDQLSDCINAVMQRLLYTRYSPHAERSC